ncbi:unnamed protein product, partial [Iphiclides podalirius]
MLCNNAKELAKRVRCDKRSGDCIALRVAYLLPAPDSTLRPYLAFFARDETAQDCRRFDPNGQAHKWGDAMD